MKVFVWEEIGHCSDNYHDGGGVVVFADSVEEAIALAEEKGCSFEEKEKTPTEIRDCSGEEKKVYIFPDAGCC